MKQINLALWITQLGLSTALPLVGFVFLGIWVRDSFGWGQWVVWAGVALGVYTAVTGFLSALKMMRQLVKPPKQEKPPLSFNDHE